MTVTSGKWVQRAGVRFEGARFHRSYRCEARVGDVPVQRLSRPGDCQCERASSVRACQRRPDRLRVGEQGGVQWPWTGKPLKN